MYIFSRECMEIFRRPGWKKLYSGFWILVILLNKHNLVILFIPSKTAFWLKTKNNIHKTTTTTNPKQPWKKCFRQTLLLLFAQMLPTILCWTISTFVGSKKISSECSNRLNFNAVGIFFCDAPSWKHLQHIRYVSMKKRFPLVLIFFCCWEGIVSQNILRRAVKVVRTNSPKILP